MLRMGIAGVGGLGTLHLKTLLRMSGQVSVEALADPIEDRRLGRQLNATNNMGLGADQDATVSDVRSYDDWSGLCNDPELDVVCIATPSDLHAPAAISALENGKHVFTEKPMALCSDDCRRMIDAAKASGRTLMVGQCLRFFPAYVKAKEIMASGEYGKPVAAFMHRYGGTPRTGWFADVSRSGGVCLDLHIHDIDAALWWWGRPARRHAHGVGTLPSATSMLSTWEYNSGLVVHLDATWDAGTPFDAVFRIIMEHATLCTRNGKLQLNTRDGRTEVSLEGMMQGHAAEMHYFIDCILRGEPVSRCLPGDSALAVSYALGEVS